MHHGLQRTAFSQILWQSPVHFDKKVPICDGFNNEALIMRVVGVGVNTMASIHTLHTIDLTRSIADHDEQKTVEMKTFRPHRVAHNRMFLMKTVLLGLLFTLGDFDGASTGDTEYQTFSMCVRGGILGMIIALCCFRPKDVQALAQEICGNLCCAIAFGPAVTFWVAQRFGIPPNIYWFVPISALLGICGLSIVKAGRSEFVAFLLDKMGFKSEDSAKSANDQNH